MCVCVFQGTNRAVEDAERERREREERLRHGRNPVARGMASASGRARAAQDIAATSPLNPASHTGPQTHTSFEGTCLENRPTLRFICHSSSGIIFHVWFVSTTINNCLNYPSGDGTHLNRCSLSSYRFGERKEGEHASSSWGACQYLLLRPDRTPGYIPHVHFTGSTHTKKELRSSVTQSSGTTA